MYQYKINSMYGAEIKIFIRNNLDGSVTSFGEYVDNTDYQTFRLDVADGVELQDPDGNVMTQDAVTEFLATLP